MRIPSSCDCLPDAQQEQRVLLYRVISEMILAVGELMWSKHCLLLMEFHASKELKHFSPWLYKADEVHMFRGLL